MIEIKEDGRIFLMSKAEGIYAIFHFESAYQELGEVSCATGFHLIGGASGQATSLYVEMEKKDVLKVLNDKNSPAKGVFS